LDSDLEPRDVKDELDFAAHVMLTLKLNQMKQTNLRGLYLREELLATRDRSRDAMRRQLETLVQSIAGIHYEIVDIWGVVSRVSQEDVTFYASVPHYARSYTKMFAAPNLKWNEPSIPKFDPKTFPVLLEKLGPAKCHLPRLRVDGRNPRPLEEGLRQARRASRPCTYSGAPWIWRSRGFRGGGLRNIPAEFPTCRIGLPARRTHTR